MNWPCYPRGLILSTLVVGCPLHRPQCRATCCTRPPRHRRWYGRCGHQPSALLAGGVGPSRAGRCRLGWRSRIVAAISNTQSAERRPGLFRRFFLDAAMPATDCTDGHGSLLPEQYRRAKSQSPHQSRQYGQQHHSPSNVRGLGPFHCLRVYFVQATQGQRQY